MGQWVTGSVVVSLSALGIAAAIACGHGGGDAQTPADVSAARGQANEEQSWAFADEASAIVGNEQADGALDDIAGANGPDPDAGPAPGPPPGMPAGWETFKAEACGITVWLPHHAEDHVKGTTHSYRYHVEGEPDGAFLVQCTPGSGGQAWIGSVEKRLAKRGTITGTTPVSLPNATGVEVKVNMTTGGNGEGRILVTPKGQEILLFVATEKDLWSQSDADAFLQSAQIQ